MSAPGLAAALLVLLLAAGAGVPAALADHEDLAGSPVSEIQARIDAASPGAVIVVEPGTYRGNLVVRVSVTLRGEGRPHVVGDGTGSVITVTAPGVTIEGLRVSGSAPGPVGGPAGIRIEADDVTVRDVVVEGTYMGIAVFGARGAKIVGNVVRGRRDAVITEEDHATSTTPAGSVPHVGGRVVRGDGVSLWDAVDALVRDNRIEHVRDGVYLSFGRNILIDRNRVADGRYAIHNMYARDLVVSENGLAGNLSGVVMMYGGPVLLLRNRVLGSDSPSTGFGVLLKDVFGCDVVENVIVGNRVGIQIDGPAGDPGNAIVVHGNTVALNRFGVSLYPSAQATFYRNSFVENTVQVVAQGHGVAGKNTWSFGGVGNYWSSYRGYDLAGEGVGDVAHVEGGTVERLIVRTPVLQALASGPAFRLLGAVEDRWVEHEPAVVDPLPLMEPHSPPLDDGTASGPASAALGGAGLAALVAASVVLVRFRRPRGGMRDAT